MYILTNLGPTALIDASNYIMLSCDLSCDCHVISPLNLCQEKVDSTASLLSGLKDGLTLIKEQDGVIDLGLSEDELEVLPSCHATQ